MEVLQKLWGEPAAFEFIERVPSGLFPLGQPDKSKIFPCLNIGRAVPNNPIPPSLFSGYRPGRSQAVPIRTG